MMTGRTAILRTVEFQVMGMTVAEKEEIKESEFTIYRSVERKVATAINDFLRIIVRVQLAGTFMG
jgi:hypothetical protein